VRRIAASEQRVMPWKNGGGTTTEVARWPEGASMDDFGWRVSLATVAVDGPFSRFAGVDRTLAVARGQGMVLAVEGRGEIALGVASLPLAFPGDVAVDARLIGGPTVDFNAMTRRGLWRHWVTRARIEARAPLEPLGDVALVYFVATGDAVVIERGEQLDPSPAEPGADARVAEAMVVDLWRA
jgi:environmental stress-induced protein Ves